MATDPSNDPALPAKAPVLGGGKTAKTALDMALREFIVCRDQTQLLELFGSLEWSADFDHKRERTRT